MKIILFESNPSHAEHIKKLFATILPEEAELTINPAALPLSSNAKAYDNALFLLDTRYRVPGRNFLSIARKIRESNEACHICFMSPSPGDIAFCYKKLVRPSAFLLKPVDESELRLLISEILAFESAKKLPPDDPQLLLKTRSKKLLVRASGILYFTSLDKKIICCTEREGSISFYGSLGTLENQYARYFLRCHSGFLVNRQRIESFSKNDMTLSLRGESTPIPVSKSRCREVERFIATSSLYELTEFN